MHDIIKWTGSSIAIKNHNIHNHDHYAGHWSYWGMTSEGVKVSSDNFDLAFSGTKDTANQLYVSKASEQDTTGTYFAYIVNITAIPDINSDTYDYVDVELSSQPVFKGASETYTRADWYTYATTPGFTVKQTNYLSSGVAETIWVGNSTLISWTDRSNAFDKNGTLSVGPNSTVTLPSTTTGLSGTMKVTGNDAKLSASVAEASETVTITSADGSTVGTSASGRTTTATITVRNPVNSIATDFKDIYLTSSTQATDTKGSAYYTPTLKNTNNKLVYNNKGDVTGDSVNLSFTTTVVSGTQTQVTAKTADTAVGYNKTLTIAANDGAKKDDGQTKWATDAIVNVHVCFPTFTEENINIGEAWKFAVGGLSSQITLETVAKASGDGDITVSTTDNLTVTGKEQGDVNVVWTTSDGGRYTMGTIHVAAGLTITFIKDTAGTIDTANFGDTISVLIGGGKSGEKYTITLTNGAFDATDGTTTTKADAVAGTPYTVYLPSHGVDSTVLKAKLEGTGTMPGDATCTLSNVTFTLS